MSESSNTGTQLVAQVRTRLTQVAWLRAALVGLACGASAWLVVSFALGRMRIGATWFAPVLAAAVGIGVAVVVRARTGTITATRAALWLEEQFPSLQFALVTLVERDDGPTVDASRALDASARARLLTKIGAPHVAPPLARTARRQLLLPAAFAVLLVAVVMPLNARLVRRGADVEVDARGNRGDTRADAAKGKPLANWRVRVVPPAYSGLETRTLGDAGSVNALVGSTIEVSGDDATSPQVDIRAVADTVRPGVVAVARASNGWRATLTMPAGAAETRFALGGAVRQLLLEPRADSLPVVRLAAPLRDSVYREPKGTVAFNAVAHDDFGLASAAIELIVTSGEGERFTAKTVVIGAQKLAGEHDRTWSAAFVLDTMKLEPGDIVHMRAVARDRHPDAAREPGTSETRTFRIARPSEYDSVAVEPAPPPEVQKSLMSQRMLLILTEKLDERRPKLSRADLVSESRKLASDQVRLRKTVGDLVFQRLEGESSAEHSHFPGDGHDHGVNVEQGKLVPTQAAAAMATGGPPPTDFEGDESPVVGINKPLLEAYNAMWDAASALDVADPKTAIPHMKLALAAIERARSAERIYLRGKPPVVVIDVAKVRLAGKDTGQVNTRSPRDAMSPKDAARDARVLAAALLMTRDVNAARDSLAVLRLESLSDAPRVAAALGDALETVRRGGDVTAALVRARRLIDGGTRADSLGVWRGVP